MKMSETDLLAFLRAEQQAAYQHQTTNLSPDRVRSVKEYLREPYGTEEDGRSSVVTSDVFDAVEGMLPDLIDVFVSSDKAVVFDPVGPEDVEGAEQATNACNHVFYKQNNGFLILYTAGKDALMLKTGGVKWWWDVKRTPSFTTYARVDEMQLASFIATNPKAEIVEKEEVEPDAQMMQQAMGQQLPKFYTVKVKTVEERCTVKVAAIPPDELQISRRHNSLLLDECPYVAHVCERTLSDLKQAGFKVDIEDLKAASEDQDESRDIRNQGGVWGWWKEDDTDIDPAMVRGWVREEYVLCDFDGDGIAERRKITRINDIILENKEVSHVPIAAWTPYMLTHRFEGISVADLVSDFQRISTEVMRQQLDNLYLANNQETVVLTDSQGNPLANIDDLLNRRPGGILRERAQGAIRPYVERWQGIEAMPMVELLEAKKENRTGWTRYSQGLDANTLNKTATGTQMIMNASQKRMKLMARIMAEALVAPMFRGIFKTLTDYCMEKLSFRLNGRFVQYDPQEWRDGYDMTINVGIGTGDVQQQQQMLTMIGQAQLALAQTPFGQMLVNPQTVYNLQARLAENAGFKNPGEFWVDPKNSPPPPPAGPPPQLMVEQAKLQIEGQKLQQAHMHWQGEMQAKLQELQIQHQQKLEEIRAQYELQATNDMRDVQTQQLKLEIDKYKADLDANVKLMIAERNNAPPFDAAPIEQALNMLAEHINAPAIILRDENGRAIGVQKGTVQKQIARDEGGNVIGVQ